MMSRRIVGSGVALVVALAGIGCSSPEDPPPSGGAEQPGGGRDDDRPGGDSDDDATGDDFEPEPAPGQNDGVTGERGFRASSGCRGAPGLTSGRETVDVNGRSREFIVDVPSDYRSTRAYPVVFGFHGRGFTADEFRGPGYGNLAAVVEEAIVVHLDAGGDEQAWDTESLADVEFFDEVLETVSDALCVDEARVFATGHSSGGYFVNLLGCQRGDVLRALAPVAGGGPFGLGGGAPDCVRPLSAWVAHAENDETVLFFNGESTVEHWAESAGCDESEKSDVSPEPCVAYADCRAGIDVHWCAYDTGHDWPAFATAAIWRFFDDI